MGKLLKDHVQGAQIGSLDGGKIPRSSLTRRLTSGGSRFWWTISMLLKGGTTWCMRMELRSVSTLL